jgi:hypothetical protein
MAADGPSPLLKKGDAVDWWFVFKFNGAAFPGCAGVLPSHLGTSW